MEKLMERSHGLSGLKIADGKMMEFHREGREEVNR